MNSINKGMEQGIASRGTGFSDTAGLSRRPASPVTQRYGIALVLVGAALVLTLLLQHLFTHPFLFLFFAAVMASAWLGGMLPGLLAVCLSTLAADYFLFPPLHSLKVNTSEEAYVVAFVICALGTSFAASLTKKGETNLKDTCDQLQAHVAERTIELEKSRAEVVRLENEISELSQRLETRKLIERAKGILQRKHKISENEAYLMLQSQSRKRSKSMKEVAETILIKDEVEGGKI